MKLVTAIIKPFRLDEVQEALAGIEAPSMTVNEVRSYRRASAGEPFDLGEERLRVEILAEDEHVEAIFAALAAASTGQPGDGRITVTPLDQAALIYTQKHPGRR
jgi:nitrogen regulatory protein PII